MYVCMVCMEEKEYLDRGAAMRREEEEEEEEEGEGEGEGGRGEDGMWSRGVTLIRTVVPLLSSSSSSSSIVAMGAAAKKGTRKGKGNEIRREVTRQRSRAEDLGLM